jgi:hypothetical protein
MRGALNNVARASENTLTGMSGNMPLEISAVGKPLQQIAKGRQPYKTEMKW